MNGQDKNGNEIDYSIRSIEQHVLKSSFNLEANQLSKNDMHYYI